MKRIIETIKDLKEILNSNNMCDNASIYLENMDNEGMVIGGVGTFILKKNCWGKPIACFEINDNNNNKPRFETVKEFKNFLNSCTDYDTLQPYIRYEWNTTIHRIDEFELLFVEVDFEIGGEPCVYLVGGDFNLSQCFIKDNYGKITKKSWGELDECVVDENGIWSPNGIYNAEGKTRDEVDY